MLYLELDFLDRFAACAQDGFKAVEFLFPYAFDKGEMGVPNLKVQMDLYHCQIAEGDLATKLRHYLPTGRVGHIQIAGVPQRHEPDLGELNYRYLFSVLDELSYTGWVGCEYRPQAGLQVGGTSAGLGWLNPIYEMPLVVQALFVQLRAIQ